MRLVPVGRYKLMRMIERGEFPSAHYITPKKPVWFDDEIERWKGPAAAQLGPYRPIRVHTSPRGAALGIGAYFGAPAIALGLSLF